MEEQRIISVLLETIEKYESDVFTLEEDVECLYCLNRCNSGWIVYLPERGIRHDTAYFSSVYDASLYIISKVINPKEENEAIYEFSKRLLKLA